MFPSLLLYIVSVLVPRNLNGLGSAALSPQERVEGMVHHAWSNYMEHAFPADELRPLSCTPTSPKEFGGLALTMVDSLDTLAIVGNASEFRSAVELTCSVLSFDVDVNVSVFESNIRLLGGLISAHLIATGHTDTRNSDMILVPDSDRTSSCLLTLAEDLGRRLLPAFDTPTKLPYGTINLRRGVPLGETPVTCVAGAGTFLLEFGALSRLTGDVRFETAARSANEALWSRRSKHQLLGAHINVVSGAWTHEDAGVGSFVDSWYEYLLKAYILFGVERDLLMFTEAYVAALRHLKRGPWYVEVNMLSKQTSWSVFGSLQCFWPALQTLFGDREQAADTMRAFMSLWEFYGFVPERYNLITQSIPGDDPSFTYALRPELAESLFYLDRADGTAASWSRRARVPDSTKRTEWQRFGLKMLDSIESECKVSCGFASIKNVSREAFMSRDGVLAGMSFDKHDHMPSFFISETLKYLYLLFEPQNQHWIDRGNFVFTTEGHILPVNDKLWKHKVRTSSPLAEHKTNRLSKLRKFAHAKCLRRSPLFELRLAIFADAGGLRSGFLGRTVGRGEVCSMSPRKRQSDDPKRFPNRTAQNNSASSSELCSHEASRYFSHGGPLWAEDDAIQSRGQHQNSLVFESRLTETDRVQASSWIFARDLNTIKWELRRHQSNLNANRENHAQQGSRNSWFSVDFESVFTGLVVCLECIMKLAALFSLRFLRNYL